MALLKGREAQARAALGLDKREWQIYMNTTAELHQCAIFGALRTLPAAGGPPASQSPQQSFVTLVETNEDTHGKSHQNLKSEGNEKPRPLSLGVSSRVRDSSFSIVFWGRVLLVVLRCAVTFARGSRTGSLLLLGRFAAEHWCERW